MLYDPRTDPTALPPEVRAALDTTSRERAWVTAEGAATWTVVPDGVDASNALPAGLSDAALVASGRCGACDATTVRWVAWSLEGWLFWGLEGDAVAACEACGARTRWGWDATCPGVFGVALACVAELVAPLDPARAERTVSLRVAELDRGERYETRERTRTWAADNVRIERRLYFETNFPPNEMQWAPQVEGSLRITDLASGATLVQRDTDLSRVQVVDARSDPVDPVTEARVLAAWRRAVETRPRAKP